nr:hypothetical protein Itr_chr06CG23880 [Ipomoea trifida]
MKHQGQIRNRVGAFSSGYCGLPTEEAPTIAPHLCQDTGASFPLRRRCFIEEILTDNISGDNIRPTSSRSTRLLLRL